MGPRKLRKTIGRSAAAALCAFFGGALALAQISPPVRPNCTATLTTNCTPSAGSSSIASALVLGANASGQVVNASPLTPDAGGTIGPGERMGAWHAAVANKLIGGQVRPGSNSMTQNLLVVADTGDSWTSGRASALGALLKAFWGDGGCGYLNADTTNTQLPCSALAYSGTWVDVARNVLAYGVDGSHTASTSASASKTWTTSAQNATLHYANVTGAADFSVSIDGGGAATYHSALELAFGPGLYNTTPNVLFTSPNDLTNAAWTKGSVSVTSTGGGYSVVMTNGVTNEPYVAQAIAATTGGKDLVRIPVGSFGPSGWRYAKVVLAETGFNYASVDLQTCLPAGGSEPSWTYIDSSSHCVFVVTTQATSSGSKLVYIEPHTTATGINETGDGANGIIVYSAAAAHVPDWAGNGISTLPSVPNARSAWAQSNVTALAPPYVLAPDGTNTAVCFVPNATPAESFTRQTVSTPAGVWTLSFYAKPCGTGEYSWIMPVTSYSEYQKVWVNTSGGVIGSLSGSAIAATASPAANGYTFVSMTLTNPSLASLTWGFEVHSANAEVSWTPNGTAGMAIWGLQLTPGTGAEVPTRVLTGSGPWYTVQNIANGLAPITGTVNTSGTAVTLASGSNFNTAWPAGTSITINGTAYRIASVASTSALTLFSSAGTQTGVVYSVSAHTFAVSTSALGTGSIGLTLMGLYATNNSGAVVVKIGWPGATVANYNTLYSTGPAVSGLARMGGPEGHVDAWGASFAVNEALGGITPTSQVASLTTLLATIAAAHPFAARYMAPAPDMGAASTYPIGSYVAAQKALSTSLGVGFVDSTVRFGPYATSSTWNVWTNTSHLNRKGYQMLANGIWKMLAPTDGVTSINTALLP